MSAVAQAPSRSRGGLPLRTLLLLPAGVALLTGIDAALMLLGAPAPVRLDRLPDIHGMLMVLGFLGTLVALERAVALASSGSRWGYAAPALLGAGGLLLLSPAPLVAGRSALLAGTSALVALYVPLWRRQRDEAVLVQALGAVLAAGAATLWLADVPVPALLPWLAGFIVLTIGGERLELARLAMGPGAGARLLGLSAALLAGVTASLLWPDGGGAVLGTTLLALTGWLAWHDVARRTVRNGAHPHVHYQGACMLAGYAWLAVAGTVWMLGGQVTEDAAYDAVVHAVFLGFAMSMVLAHAPVILPAVLRRPLPYHQAMIGPAVLLHASLVVRLWLGGALGSEAAWVAGGLGNIAALLAFVGVAVWSATRRTA